LPCCALQHVDSAALRRFSSYYVKLPTLDERVSMMQHHLDFPHKFNHIMSRAEWQMIGERTESFSGSDLKQLCRHVAERAVQDLAADLVDKAQHEDLRPLTVTDFEAALDVVHSSISESQHRDLEAWATRGKHGAPGGKGGRRRAVAGAGGNAGAGAGSGSGEM